MQNNKNMSFFTLLLMISFASVNAVLFTPALPNIASFFSISSDIAQHTISWFLVGYAFGQLIYGPLANRFGRKPALYIGVSIQILSSLLCASAAYFDSFSVLVLGRFLLALGSGVGLKMTFTLVNESFEPKIASQKISYLVLAFAVTPGLGVALGGFLNAHFGWPSCFYAGAIYGGMLLLLVTQLPETQIKLDYDALKIKNLIHDYAAQFTNFQLIGGGVLMGVTTCFVYVFAAVAPFIAISQFGMSSEGYGAANLLPPIGLILGSITSANLVKKYSLSLIIRIGILISGCGIMAMFAAMMMQAPLIFSLFLPMIIIYFGASFIMANASTIAMSQAHDKAHGAAVMSFINMGLATLVVLSLGLFEVKYLLLPSIFITLWLLMLGVYHGLRKPE